jgi:hypothetical protein
MFSAVLLSLLAFIPSAFARSGSEGCKLFPDPDEKPHRLDEPIKIHGRDVWVSFPAGYNGVKAAPLIIALHDAGQSPQDLQKVTFFSNQNVNGRAVVVYPSTKDVKLASGMIDR